MKLVERLFGLLVALGMVLYGTEYFKEYRYDTGRWIAGGLVFFGAILVCGCIAEWREEHSVKRALATMAPPRNRRLPVR